MSKAKQQLKGLFQRLRKATNEAIKPAQMRLLANEAVKIIVKRTRLGYGVKEQYGERFKLSEIPWSPVYQQIRKLAKKSGTLDQTTAPKKANLTFTGQMLRSIKAVKIDSGAFSIQPTGSRKEGGTNYEIALANAKRGRVFNKLSQNEYNQILRLYRRGFTDLLKRLALIK